MSDARFNSILVVDDSATSLQLLLSLLTEHGYTVYPASDGGLALEFVQSTLPGLILLDVRMPGLDGYEVCRRLKADERTAAIPVIFLSALEDERDKLRGFQAGGVDFLTKPFQPPELLARVGIHLRLRNLTESLEEEVGARTEELSIANRRLLEEIAERERAQRELRGLNEELDRRVKERTAELVARNEDMQVTERELIREREFGRALLESMADGVVACDAEGTLALFNRAAREWHGVDPMRVPPEEWASRYDLRRPDGVTPLPTREIPLAMAFEGEEVKDVGMAIVAKGKAPRFIVANGSTITGADGRKLGAVAVMRDVTAFRSLERQLRRANEELEQRVADRTAKLEETARSLKEAQRLAHVGSWELDLKTNVLTWSDEVHRMFEVDRGDFGGTFEAFLAAIHPDDREAVRSAYADSLELRTPYAIEHRLPLPGGRIKYVLEQWETQYDDGSPLRSIGTAQDITERKRSEEAIRQLNQDLERRVRERTLQLEAVNSELEAFAYSVSHDLRAPLRHINAFVAMIQKRAESTLDADSKRYLATVSSSAVHLANLIDDLLSFSRLGRSELTKTRVDLGDLVREVIQGFDVETQGRSVDWRIADLPVVTGDRAMLRVALVNLISNALKFTQPRARAVIEIGCPASEVAETVVFVRDNGVGFDMQYVDKLFGVFQRLHPADEFEGTGIGLANVCRVITRHGGRTWAEGKVDEGATFYFALPRPAGAG